MFTGFASENTPAIQVWDFFRTFASTNAVRTVSLEDDCAPIQVFRTGGGASAIRVYLPTAPIEGKQIIIANQQFGSTQQRVEIYSSDRDSGGASISLFTLGSADSLVLVYSKQNISFGQTVGVVATGWISLNKSSPTAGNSYAAIVGGNSNTAQAQYSFIGGGSLNTTSGASSAAVVGGSSNTASGSSATVVGGASNTANNTNAAAVGGSSNTASGNAAFVGGGSSNTASSTNSAVVGGGNNAADISNSVVIGGSHGTTRSIVGNFVTPASSSPITGSVGRQQLARLLLGRETTNATPTVLASNSGSASTVNQVILPNNSAYTFQGTVIANVTGGGTTSGWKFEGVIKRGGIPASTTLVAAVTPTVIAQDAGAAAWVVAVTADTTNGGIAVTVTGAAATTIRWVCKIETTEVTF